ncbi:MAG: N-acetylneuraminate synthase family protein [Bacteroidetes bacterium]|nr:N-acetylneuraminate synthase family protein [Bacteroidota bacterium]
MNNIYFYTETAFHHQGDMNFMKDLIDVSKKSGAQGVKFQVMTRTADFVSTKHKAYKDLDSYCFNLSQWHDIFTYTNSLGLDIVMMPLNMEAFELLNTFDVKYLDIHSVSFYDNMILNTVKNAQKDIILGVGGRTLEEIEEKINFFGNNLKVLMVGFQSFPSKLEDVKIGKISFLKKKFPDLKIGYADHSAFDSDYAITSNEYASILGATIFEKHITTTEGVERVDYSAAVSLDKMKKIIEKVKFVNNYVMTDYATSFEFTAAESIYRERQLRCVARADLKCGTILTSELISLKLIDDQVDSFSNVEDLIGKTLLIDLDMDCVVKFQNVK